MEVRRYFEELKAKHNGDLEVQNSRWFSGHANLPLHTFKLTFPINSSSFIILYEFRQSEFSSSSNVDGGTYNDRHICNIKYAIHNSSYLNFNITKPSLISKIFNKNYDLDFAVKSSSTQLEEILERSKELIAIYKIVNESSDFEPLIVGKRKGDSLHIEIAYSTLFFKENIITEFISFCKMLAGVGNSLNN